LIRQLPQRLHPAVQRIGRKTIRPRQLRNREKTPVRQIESIDQQPFRHPRSEDAPAPGANRNFNHPPKSTPLAIRLSTLNPQLSTLNLPGLPSFNVQLYPAPVPPPVLGYKIAVLVFLQNEAGDHLLLHRAKPPNLGAWSPIGGKLETAIGE